MDRLMGKINNNLDDIIHLEEDLNGDEDVVVLAYGSTVRSAISAVNQVREDGVKAGWVKLKTIWPFADDYVRELAEKVDRIIVPELNMGQLIGEVKRVAAGKAEVTGINRYDGTLITPADVVAEIKGAL